jgi:two-component system sensor kinase FixL
MSRPPREPRARRRRMVDAFDRSPVLDTAACGDDARDAEPLLVAVMERVADGVLILDEAGVVVDANAAAERRFGEERDGLLGANAALLLPCWRAALDGVAAPRAIEARRKDGARFPVELSAEETRGANGRRYVAVLRETVAADARLQELQAELAYARRLTAMGEMASALAHEINQPFSAIATYVRTARWLLQKKPKQRSPEIEDILDKAGAQAMRAGEIIRRLREFVTRGDSVKTVQRLSAMVDEATALAFAGSRKGDAQLHFENRAPDDFVLADRVQIQQVVLNLMRNAIEAMESAPKRELSLSTSVADGFVRLDVADSGHGLSEDMLGALFAPFRTTKANGMGLGLSISRSIVEAHGGRIWAERNPRGGAIFSFTLPQAPVEARPE